MPVSLMWGERGLVATFFMDLSAVDNLDRWIGFLREIKFVHPGPGLDWTQVQEVWTVVEPGFGSRGFGNPDAAFRLELVDGRRIVVLLEAKLGCYQEACWLPVRRGRDGFNSRLNGQLELNHCLTLALNKYQMGDHRLIDPEWVLQTPYAAARPRGARRRVNDPSVRQQIVEPLINSGADLFLHVIVTADQHNPLEDEDVQCWLPEIFVDAQQGNKWVQVMNQFGWTNWRGLWNLAEDWPAPPARFRENLVFNLPNLFPPGAAGCTDEPPAGMEHGLHPGWPPGRPARGVSLIFAPTINPQTFLHFSWRRNSCRLRNYVPDPPPPASDNYSTMQGLQLIMREESVGPRRPPTGNVAQWRAIIQEVNHRYGLDR